MRIARELTLEAAQSAASNRSSKADYSSRTYSVPHIKKLLDSRHEKETLDGLRRVISVWRCRNAERLQSGEVFANNIEFLF